MDVAGPQSGSTIATIAALEVIQFECSSPKEAIISNPSTLARLPAPSHQCKMLFRGRSKTLIDSRGEGSTLADAIADALKPVLRMPLHIASFDHFKRDDQLVRCLVTIEKEPAGSGQLGVGRSVEATDELSLCIALLRAANHAGILGADFSANNQRSLRNAARELMKATVGEILGTLPKVPETAIPWIVKFFENPESWFRFRGAIHLADHDVLHVLLGRGLQDQDEAFVLGFAIGTAKKVSWFQYHVFKQVIVRLYPEPYRIPAFLLPTRLNASRFATIERLGASRRYFREKPAANADPLMRVALSNWKSHFLGHNRALGDK